MLRSLYSAGSGLITGQRQVDTIANNVANINTVGFKESRVNFQDIFYANLQQNKNHDPENRLSNLGILIGSGVMPSSVTQRFTQGPLITTNNTFDLALEGPGFFGVEKDGQLHLTRHGNFDIDASGGLVNSDGFPVSGQYANLLDYTDISINANGIISGTNIQGAIEQIGIINVYNVTNPGGLQSEGENLYTVTVNSGPANQIVSNIKQGMLEGSNVDLSEQLTRLIMNQRALEASAKLIHSTDEMMSQANNLRR